MTLNTCGLLRWIWSAACFLALPAAPLFAGGPEDLAVRQEKLDNGLTVLLVEKHDAPVVSSYLWYAVGSADENPEAMTGLAHFLEHMLFKGTDRYRKGEIDRITLEQGGANNAFTAEEYTAYFFNFASDRWQVALQIEASRMRGSLLDEAEFLAEKEVVREELKRAKDSPFGLLELRMEEELFGRDHPYGHPILGFDDQLEGMTREQMKAYYDAWYQPGNATLILVGDFDGDQALETVKSLFGAIPKGRLPKRRKAPSVRVERTRRFTIEQDTQTVRFLWAFPSTTVGNTDDYALDMLSSALAGSKSSRLYRLLVDEEPLCTAIDASNDTRPRGGAFYLRGECLPGVDPRYIEWRIQGELAKLAREGLSAEERARFMRETEARQAFALETADGIASTLGHYQIVAGDWRYFTEYRRKVEKISDRDLKRAAARYLRADGAVIGLSAPRGWRDGVGSPDHPIKKRSGVLTIQRETLFNGLKLRLSPRPGSGTVALSAYVKADRRFEPREKAGLASLTGALLSAGTASHSARELAEAVDDLGAQLSTHDSGADIKVLARDLPQALSILTEVLYSPSFPQGEFDKQKTRTLARLQARRDDPTALAYDEFRALVYGEHPFGYTALGFADTVQKLTREDVAAHHRAFIRPANTTLVIAGDFRPDAVMELLAQSVGTVADHPDRVVFPKVAAPPGKTAGAEKLLPMPDKEQINVFMGHLGIARSDPDYYKLLVMDYILGTGPGFTDRLSRTLRDEQGLCYSVYATITSSAGEEAGPFVASIGTSPRHRGRVLEGLRGEISRIREQDVDAAELQAAKDYLTGSFVFKMETNEDLAALIQQVELYGLGDDYPLRFAETIKAVTVADIRAVAKAHLSPESLHTVIAGPIDDEK